MTEHALKKVTGIHIWHLWLLVPTKLIKRSDHYINELWVQVRSAEKECIAIVLMNENFENPRTLFICLLLLPHLIALDVQLVIAIRTKTFHHLMKQVDYWRSFHNINKFTFTSAKWKDTWRDWWHHQSLFFVSEILWCKFQIDN